jgi:drug/metabolite transporter (DMT)-like permease
MFNWLVLSVLGTIWGASYMFIKIGVAEIPPFTFVSGRVLIAALVLLLAVRLRGFALPSFGRAWLPLVAMGIFNGVIPYTAITWGEQSISSGLAAILTGAMPIFTVILAHFLTHDERLTFSKVLGVLIGFGGVAVLFVPDLQPVLSKAEGNGLRMTFWGDLAVVGAAASYAIATLVARRYLLGTAHMVASAGQLLSAAALMLPLSLAFDNPLELRPSLAPLASLVTLAVLGTAVAYVMYYWLIERIGATGTSLVTYVIPVTALMWGALILGERFDVFALVGLALIIAGIGLVNRRPRGQKT